MRHVYTIVMKLQAHCFLGIMKHVFLYTFLSNCITTVHRKMQAQMKDRKALEMTLCEQSRESKKRHQKFLRQSEARWRYNRIPHLQLPYFVVNVSVVNFYFIHAS